MSAFAPGRLAVPFAVCLACGAPSAGRRPAATPAGADRIGFDPPVAERTVVTGKSRLTDPPQDVRLTCRVYPAHAVLEIDDPGLKGAGIGIRPRPEGGTADACVPAAAGRAVALPENEGYVLGVAGPYLFVRDPDDFGVASGFHVHELASGREVRAGTRHAGRTLALRRRGSVVSLRYHALLAQVPCVPGPHDAGCWERVRTANGMPPGAPIPAPDCAAAVRAVPSVLETHAVQIAVPVQVPDVARPGLVWEAGPTTCDAAP